MDEQTHEKLAVCDLAIGMYVAELDRPWLESPFLFQGFPIRTQDELQQLQECCEYVYVDKGQSVNWPAEQASDNLMTPPPNFATGGVNRKPQRIKYRDKAGFSETLPDAVQLYNGAKGYIDALFDDVRLGHSIDTENARRLADRMAENIVQNENALVWLTQLKNRDEYTSLHSINVCVLSLLFGRYLGLNESQLQRLGLGALLHDLGKMCVPNATLNKPGRLDANEKVEMRRHPEHGYQLLKDTQDMHPAVLEIVRSHHERVDGTGYPQGLKGKAINQYALIVSIVDVYDAVTSDRAYHLGISPHEALNMIYGWATKTFPRELVESFIQCLGIYPIGSLVELENGEVGVVMTVNRTQRLNPILTLVLDRQKKPFSEPKLINMELQQKQRDNFKIKRILESSAYGIDVRKLILQSNMSAPAVLV